MCIENGAYGKRLGKVCEVLGIDYQVLSFPEDQYVDSKKVEEVLKGDKSITMVSVVHCETSSGVINPVTEVGAVVKSTLPGEAFLLLYSETYTDVLYPKFVHISYSTTLTGLCKNRTYMYIFFKK